ncbi:MAG: L-threonylcarbamoyladenylate synthase [Candidatus Nanoarchaeia archaeon]|jgi:tRNA threonylcarbamoyl adenosine modification protein (Sua5/YciO/YrdC/YwlC family)
MIIIYPTETCYGLGCSAFDKEGIKKIYELKKRDSSKPLILLVDSIKMWKQIAKVSKKAEALAKKHWPGALTIIQPKKSCIPDLLAKEEIGVRLSPHRIPNKLIKELKAPIVSTSANIAGGKTPYSIGEIPESIKKHADKIIDYGKLEFNPASTVIKIEKNKVLLVRKGSIENFEL